MRRTIPLLVACLSLVAACGDKDDGGATADSKAADTTTDDADTTATPDTTSPDDTSSPDTSSPDTTTGGSGAASIEWEELGDGTEQGSLEVPLDYDDPGAGVFDLYIVRHNATDPDNRIGSLLVNPGGPGFGGSVLAANAASIYDDELLEKFDIIGWDPRGTGLTEPHVNCIDDYDKFYGEWDLTPDDDDERQAIVDLAKELAESCAEKNPWLASIGTNNSARDMNAIREALGEEKISYFGWSYGSELGAVWATLFPDTVRAAAIDGAADPTADPVESSLQQSKGFEDTLATYLAQCSADDTCPFNNDGNAEAAFDALMQQIDENPLPAIEGRPKLTRVMALTGVSQAMYSDDLWPQLSEALADAQDGDGTGLMTLYDEYYGLVGDKEWNDDLEAFQAISCMDDEERTTVEEEDAITERYREVAPRLAPGTTGGYFCSFFPKATDPRVDVTGKGAGPILVMGTTGDASTPLASTKKMAETLEDGRLVVVTANQHTGYGVNECSVDVIVDYLVDPEKNAPEDGFACPE
jgi:pimeloyl-ACP methyl ester carboxylesterase